MAAQNHWRLVLVFFFLAALARAQEPVTVLLWPNGAPGALGNEDSDQPSLTIFLPVKNQANGTGVIVCPGGGYGALASNHEGRQVANWLNSLGIAAFVLKYRLGPRYHHPIELGDAQRAIRLVRAHAGEYGVTPDRLGVMGFSAGGHLAATMGTHFDNGNAADPDPMQRASSRPDFLVLGYPVISFTTPYTHQGSLHNLLGDNPDPKLIQSLSNELQVTAQTPPTFLFHTTEDQTVPVENSVLFYLALRKAGVAAEMHIFERGPHGVGLALRDPALALWPELLANWFRMRGLLNHKD
ncbi:MAG TPA: alpha/beta hydrolase [Bryobacteraceae bacterium]|nr:alpha/beta hydrolase [Bryobacteraceae bacterium]